MRPTDAAQLNVGMGFLWPHQQWRLYQIQRRWNDGILARCCHPQHHHELFLPNEQWLISMSTPTPTDQASWLDALGPHWATPQLQITIRGDSMWPTIATPSTIGVAPWTGLQEGQVALWGEYGPDGKARWVAHRIIDLGAMPGHSSILARGDNNLYPDPPLHPSQLLGLVVTANTAHGPGDPNSHTARLKVHLRRIKAGIKRQLPTGSRH